MLPEDLIVLIEGCCRGERQAQKALYERFSPMIYGRIRRYVPEQSHADELLNETFYKVLTSIGNYRFSGAFEGWMHRIAMNTITDFLRRHIRYRERIAGDVDNMELSVPDTAVSRLSYQELLLLIHELPDMQRAVFNLFVLDQCSHKEIAAYLGISEANSRWQLNDARKRLKEKLNRAF